MNKQKFLSCKIDYLSYRDSTVLTFDTLRKMNSRIVLLLVFCSILIGICAITIEEAWKEFHVEEDVAADEYYQLGLGAWGYTSSVLNEFYFDGHDTDHNTKLDGLELLHSLRKRNVSFERAEWIVDFVLHEADEDRDGVLDYAEYLNSRKQSHHPSF
jgi:hypothetical protein